ncbi:TIGR02646 family protein [Polyangium fumosum]|uniref:TIGR02646 family protein n=1 Tax=Polyangium fumosum TaxID=889272 RepID=A0A4U1JIA4_9BACT|nr:TIGR02646 family protein [Polyangium fumosum]TKD12375.1 TIGR02646 family protein [Polyangium fumosum]
MRTIKKRPPPSALVEWRAKRLTKDPGEGMKCTYEELRRDTSALPAVEDGLFAEQGGICAYTGIQIRLDASSEPRKVDFHLEHVTPQKHCIYGQDADYGNLVACWPRPNCGFEPLFGAVTKKSWPSPEEKHLFVSPLDPGCTARFSFNHRGEISPADEKDDAAKTTIEKLGLAHATLTDLRRGAILGALQPPGRLLSLEQARRLLATLKADAEKLDQGGSVRLRAFSFVIEQVLPREIRKLEGIKKSKQKAAGSARK